ncbi:hypothetical protein [Brevibacterium renqingii]|uniref:hypothetical protein n=1 Tax=Brevibacterium renqingii TaxID=2776916 RepID=UPI001AE084E5|nr:hypothetical protein [Brevibacterium renqingii]
MAEEQFTSRRARREAERLAAEQAFEARGVPEQPNEAPNSRADLLSPLPPKKPEAAPDASAAGAETGPESGSGFDSVGAETDSRIDPAPSPRTNHERGALASDHPLESRPPVNAEDRLDPQRTPLPHFESRAEKKRYLREHGLSLNGDLSTGALPVVADEEELAERRAAAEGRLTGPVPEVSETDSAELPEATDETEQPEQEHESYDAAGFGGASEEVAARDFEAPVTAESAPRPTSLDDEPYDALSKPYSALEGEDAAGTDRSVAETGQNATEDEAPSAAVSDDDVLSAEAPSSGEDEGPEPSSRSRRMPIVQPPSTSGVRVVTAASAQAPEVDESANGQASPAQEAPSAESESGAADAPTDWSGSAGTQASESGSDDAARALAANPETRPMDAVPEAWALPNADYEDEETENPPGTRIRASSVTGQDGKILMGEEPSKMPYIILGVAAFFALALIVIALVMFL